MIETGIFILLLILSIVVHEVAHGWMADLCGDPTAREMGRLTLNPFPHLDLIGSVLIPLFLVLSQAGFFIGWAKPVPVNTANLRHPRRDSILVSAAGPGANFLLAFVATLLIIIQHHSGYSASVPDAPESASTVQHILIRMLSLNIFLAVFNLLPCPPLDGWHVVSAVAPSAVGRAMERLGIAGAFLLLLLLNVPFFQRLFLQLVHWCAGPFQYLIRLAT